MTTRLVGEILKTLGLIACALAIGCGETSGTGTGSDGAPVAPPRTDEDQVVGDDNAGDPADPGDDDPSNDPVDDEASDTPFDDNADDASDAPEPGDEQDEQEDAEPKSTTYLFDCETFVGGLDDLLLDVTVTPFEAFASGLPNSVTLSGSITLTEPIVEGIAGFVEVGVDMAALSFVRSAHDMRRVGTEPHPRGPLLVAKIETRAAVENLDGIIAASGAIMVARGDLGNELPMEDLPITQKTIIQQCIAGGKPVITATQMLESMITAPAPTRDRILSTGKKSSSVTSRHRKNHRAMLMIKKSLIPSP